MHFIEIFLDGFGLGTEDNNPIVAACTPYLDELLGGHRLWGRPHILRGSIILKPLDACLGLPGVPQSATGQTTLWTGVNAAQVLGYHLNAYPNDTLKQIIEEKSIFKQLACQGRRIMFANTFTEAYDKAVAEGKRRHTASTLCALAGGIRLRRVPDLLKGLAVYHDMTNELLREQGEDVPLLSSYTAGQNLARLALCYDFTLYEFFQTDVIGHKQLWNEAVGLIERIDGFIGGLLSVFREVDEKVAWILTSDHGNVEDFQVKGHTTNPVPILGWANFPITWPDWESLTDVTPGILQLLARE